MSPMWISIEPGEQEVRLQLSIAGQGPMLRARLPLVPAQPRALATLLESLVAWHGRALVAVLDADASDVRRHGERWARLLGDLDGEHIRVQWSAPGPRGRDRFLGKLGDFRGSGRLLGRAATGVTP